MNTLMWARCVKAAVTQDPYVLMKCSSLFCLGTAMNCDVIWLDASNIQWGEGIIHLTANGLEHQVQFHCTLGSTRTAYFELATSTEAVKNLQVPLLFVFRYRPCKHPAPKSQKLLNSGLQPPVLLIQSSKELSYDHIAAASEAQNQARPGQAGAKSRRKD